MKIGIFGGTFNPPHRGHFLAAAQAVDFLGLDRLLIIPAGTPPHKAVPEDIPSPSDRLALTRLAFSALSCAEVSDWEINRDTVSYTIDTLRHYQTVYPEDELILLVGEDMLLTLDTWYEGKTILQEYAIAAFARHDGDEPLLTAKISEYRKSFNARISLVPISVTDVSSTAVREALPKRQGRDCLDEEVYHAIIRKRLYGAKPEFAWLRGKAYAMLKKKRIPHVMGCEEEAVKMAKFWGEDPEDAAEAGILHDITKKLNLEEQLRLCDKYDIVIDALESKSEKLLHSKTGAAVARDEFGISDRVFTAISWHTTGRRAMSLLEKILYLADYMEPTRDFEGVDRLRELCYSDLNAAMALGLKMSIEDLNERGVPIHKKTAEALEYYLNNTEE